MNETTARKPEIDPYLFQNFFLRFTAHLVYGVPRVTVPDKVRHEGPAAVADYVAEETKAYYRLCDKYFSTDDGPSLAFRALATER